MPISKSLPLLIAVPVIVKNVPVVMAELKVVVLVLWESERLALGLVRLLQLPAPPPAKAVQVLVAVQPLNVASVPLK